MRRAALIYGLFAGVLFARFLFLGEVYISGDILTFVYPWKAYLNGFPSNIELFDVPVFFYPQDVFFNQSLKAGVFPLWNPHIFSGHPAVASGQSGFFYPPRVVLHWLFSTGVAKTWLQLLHLLGMGFAMRWFLSLRGFGTYAATLGGLMWMGNSFVISWLEFEHAAIAGFYLPLLLGALEKGLGGSRWGWIALPALGALSLHSGHLQVCLYTGLIFIAYAAVRLWQAGDKRYLLWSIPTALLTVGLAAPTVLPFLELLRESQRVPLNIQDNAASFWSICLSLFNPDLFGNPAKGFMLNRCTSNLIYPEFACFVGSVGLAYALSARGRAARALQGLSVFCVVVASASFSISLPLLDRFIPGRILLVLVFCLTYLAAIGAEQSLQESKTASRVALGLGTAWLIILAGLQYLLLHPDTVLQWAQANPRLVKLPPSGGGEQALWEAFRDTYAWNPQLFIPLLGYSLVAFRPSRRSFILGVSALELLLFAVGFNPSMPKDALFPTTPEIQAMADRDYRTVSVRCANYNTLTPFDLSMVNGYESLVSRRYGLALSQAEPERPLPMRSLSFDRLDGPILDALALKYALLPPGEPPPVPGWEVALESKGGVVLVNKEVRPRAYLVSEVRPLRDPRELQSFEPAKMAFASAAPPFPLEPGPSQVQWLSESANRLELEVECETAQFLVLTDSYHQGWKCYEGSVQLPITPANLCSRGVYLAAGKHRLDFRFEPDSLREGSYAFWISLVIMLLLIPTWGMAGKRAEAEEPAEHE